MEDITIANILWKLNENVLLSAHFTSTNALLMFPYSVSLKYSIVMKNENHLFNNLTVFGDYLSILVRIFFHTSNYCCVLKLYIYLILV